MSKNVTSFNASKGYGEKGVKIVEQYLNGPRSTGFTLNVESNDGFRLLDVDLIYWNNNLRKLEMIEVKFDSHTYSNNIFVETISNENTGKPGYIYSTEADYIYYLFDNSLVLYIIPVTDFRVWFIENIDRFHEVSSYTGEDKVLYKSIGKLVPISVMINEVKNIEIKFLEEESPAELLLTI